MEFVDVTSSSDIICLQETREEVSIPNFMCYNKNRTDSKSGGLCICIHRAIALKVQEVKTKCEDIQAVRISEFFSDRKRDLLLINVYNSPKNSSYKRRKLRAGKIQDATLDILQDLIMSGRDCEVILLGDFNARTANLNYCPSDEAVNFFNDKTVGSISCPGPDEHYRVSQDSSINSNGTKLIEVLKSTSLTILNGNTIGDVSGQFTCHVYNGSSVVDYMICSEYLISRLLKFRVHELNTLSDHCPYRAI